jgi:hypothetical protein
MATNITDNLHESIPDDHHNPSSKIKSNLKDTHFKRRNNRSNKNVVVER